MIEEFKDIEGYDGIYQVGNLGNVKSLKCGKERLLKPWSSGVYLTVGLSKNGKIKRRKIHKLVAIAFLGHTPNGYKSVVNHKDNNPLNNKLDNLELTTNRVNCSVHKTDVGICWYKNNNKWLVRIWINNRAIHLGYFIDKQKALDKYQKALENIENYNGNNNEFRNILTL